MNNGLYLQLRSVLADVIGIDEDSITPESTPDDVAGWDSVRHLNIILTLEEDLEIEFELEEIENSYSVALLMAILEKRVG